GIMSVITHTVHQDPDAWLPQPVHASSVLKLNSPSIVWLVCWSGYFGRTIRTTRFPACSRRTFHPFCMSPPLAGFGEASAEIFGRGPGPGRLEIRRSVDNVQVLFAFPCRPGLDEQEQLGARNAVGELETMQRQ